MVGVLGCAPLLGGVSTVDNGTHGGTLDIQEFGPGLTATAISGGGMISGDFSFVVCRRR